MKYLIIITLLLTCINGNAQHAFLTGEDPCSGMLYLQSKFYNEYPYKRYHDFVNAWMNNNYPSLGKFITYNPDRFQIIPLKNDKPGHVLYCRKTFLRNNINVDLFYKTDTFSINLDEIHKDEYLFFRDVMTDLLKHKYYGYIRESASPSVLKIDSVVISFKGKKIILNNEYFGAQLSKTFDGLKI